MHAISPTTGGRPGGSGARRPAPSSAALILALIASTACAQQRSVDRSDESRADPAPRVRPQTAPPADPSAVKPLEPVVIDPPAPPQAHPLAPESMPNKPQTIPDEVPGTKPPR